MNEPTPPPPPPSSPKPAVAEPPATPPTPPAPTESSGNGGKKGLPTLAWVGIGCGCLLLLAAAATFIGSAYLVKKGSEKISQVASDMEANPVVTSAELLVKAHPDLELVESDREASKVKVRDKRTGEVFVFDAQDIAEGRLVIGKEGEEQTITVRGEGGEGTVEMEGPQGKTTFRAGKGAGGDLPDWVPVPAGAERAEGVFSMDTPEGASGTAVFLVEDDPDAVAAFYQEELEGRGFELDRTSFSTGGTESITLRGENPEEQTILVAVTQEGDGRTRVAVWHSTGQR